MFVLRIAEGGAADNDRRLKVWWVWFGNPSLRFVLIVAILHIHVHVTICELWPATMVSAVVMRCVGV